VRELAALDVAARLREPDLDHLPRIVPLVHGGRDVEPFVALQPDEVLAEAGREHLRDLGLADARLALEEERPLQLERQKHGGREAALGDVVLSLEEREGRVDGCGSGIRGRHGRPTIRGFRIAIAFYDSGIAAPGGSHGRRGPPPSALETLRSRTTRNGNGFLVASPGKAAAPAMGCPFG
jgi:hypothetical protein